LSWTLDAANYADGVERLQRNMPAIKPGVVDVVMRKLLAEETGLTPGGEVDSAGMKTVLELRSRYGLPRRELSDAEVGDGAGELANMIVGGAKAALAQSALAFDHSIPQIVEHRGCNASEEIWGLIGKEALRIALFPPEN